MRQSKLLPAETLFADLCLARQNVDSTRSGLGSQSAFSCPHSSPCLAPEGGHSPGFWLLAAIDQACAVVTSTRPASRLLELSRTDCGALEFVMTKWSAKPEPGQLVAVDSQAARKLKEDGAPVQLWNPWKAAKAVTFSTGNSSWQLQVPDHPLVDLVVGMTSHQDKANSAGQPAASEHSTLYRSELLWRCLASLNSLAPGMNPRFIANALQPLHPSAHISGSMFSSVSMRAWIVDPSCA